MHLLLFNKFLQFSEKLISFLTGNLNSTYENNIFVFLYYISIFLIAAVFIFIYQKNVFLFKVYFLVFLQKLQVKL